MEASRELPKVPRSLPCSASIQRVSAASDAPCGSGGLKSTITGPVPSDASAARLRSRSSTASVLLCPNPNSESLQRSLSSRHCTREASSVASHAHVSNTDVNSGADSSERQRPAQDRSARGRSSGVSKLPAICCEANGTRKPRNASSPRKKRIYPDTPQHRPESWLPCASLGKFCLSFTQRVQACRQVASNAREASRDDRRSEPLICRATC
jgi:hypothetical protein